MKTRWLISLLYSFSILTVAQNPGASKWRLTWADEFNGPRGSSFDSSKWTAETGGSEWGNHELEYYKADKKNVHQEDGNLVIVARREDYTAGNETWHYTSARLKTLGKFSQKYGRFEARIEIPFGQGIWPAFWMLGDDIKKIGWPACGEIDVMENIGKEPGMIHGTLHGPGYSGQHGIGSPYTVPGSKPVAAGFHVFAVEWEPEVIRFYVDNTLYETRTPADLPAGAKWVYDHPFFLLLNLAVGGDWPGPPDSTTRFPQKMLIDYVRVYTADPQSSHQSAITKGNSAVPNSPVLLSRTPMRSK